MYTSAKTVFGNISQYEGYNCLLTMTKPKSPLSVGFFSPPEDNFMINVVRYKTKSGEIVYDSQIIEPDLPQFIRSYERDGFVPV